MKNVRVLVGVVAGIALLAALALAGAARLASYWEKNVWRPAASLERIESLPDRFPKAETNGSARTLVELAAKLGIGMGPGGGPGLAEGERKAFHEVGDELRRFVWGQVQKPADELEAPPPRLAGYLAAHAAHLESLRIHVLQHEVPLWETERRETPAARTPRARRRRGAMNTRRLFAFAALTGLLCASSVAAQERTGAERLGKVQFPVSCSPAAQQEFERAVALLHSFWFDAAGKGFVAVVQADPACAMGHWGEAMTHLFSPNPFVGVPTPKGLQAGCPVVDRAKAAGAKTPREKDYIGAVESLCKDRDKADQRARVVAYEQAMAALAARYPEDREAAVFYALALNVTASPADKTYANQLKAASILEKVFAEQPNHPGVAHYLIHSYDYPPIASRGLSAARRYAGIAPSAPHALHMPSHIFTREGFWVESIESNQTSAAAAKDHFNKLHAMDYLAYAYLQMAQDVAAKRVLDEMHALGKPNVEHFVTGYALAAIPSRYALERRRWAEAASLTLSPSDFPWSRYAQSEAVLVFARGLGAARSGNVAVARQSADRLQVLRETLTAAKLGYWAEQADIQRRTVAAWLARAAGKAQEALPLLRAAADAEDATEKHPVTPGPLVPGRELLGEMLLEAGQHREALKEFEASMRIEPNRFRGLYGAARAAELSGDREKARTYYQKMLALSAKADTERPERVEAKAFLAIK